MSITYDGLTIAAHFGNAQMLRIQRSEVGNVVTFILSGRFSAEHAAELKRLLEAEVCKDIVVDLEEVTLVDQDAVNFLARCEIDSVRLTNCSAYIREWILLVTGSTRAES